MLYLRNKFLLFEIDNVKLNAKIINVNDSGKIILMFENKKLKSFGVNDIRFLF